MDLEEFVAETLRQIVKGVVRAQRETHELGARIYPVMPAPRSESGRLTGEDADANSRPIYDVEFNVAVTVTSSTGSDAKLKARLYVVEAGIGGKSGNESITASRVSFTLPIIYPVHSGRRPEWGEA
jgi:hypothetical protein